MIGKFLFILKNDGTTVKRDRSRRQHVPPNENIAIGLVQNRYEKATSNDDQIFIEGYMKRLIIPVLISATLLGCATPPAGDAVPPEQGTYGAYDPTGPSPGVGIGIGIGRWGGRSGGGIGVGYGW